LNVETRASWIPRLALKLREREGESATQASTFHQRGGVHRNKGCSFSRPTPSHTTNLLFSVSRALRPTTRQQPWRPPPPAESSCPISCSQVRKPQRRRERRDREEGAALLPLSTRARGAVCRPRARPATTAPPPDPAPPPAAGHGARPRPRQARPRAALLRSRRLRAAHRTAAHAIKNRRPPAKPPSPKHNSRGPAALARRPQIRRLPRRRHRPVPPARVERHPPADVAVQRRARRDLGRARVGRRRRRHQTVEL
jgi:hypothetical protein